MWYFRSENSSPEMSSVTSMWRRRGLDPTNVVLPFR